MINNVNKKLTTGILWQAIQHFGQKGSIFIVAIVLARLLEPSVFGLFAITFVFVSIFQVFTEGGLGVALVQRQEVSESDYYAIFTYNLLLSILCILCLWYIAPLIAVFYHSTELIWLIRILSLKILFAAFCVASFASLRRTLCFKELAQSRLAATVLSALTGIIMAFCGCGVWSLIGQQFMGVIVITLCYQYFSPCRMRICFKSEHFLSLLKFGSGLMGNSMIKRITDNIYTLIIGKYFSTEILGFYSRAVSLNDMVAKTGVEVIGESMATILYRLQDDLNQMCNLITRSLRLSGLVIIPALTGIAIVAEPLIATLFGENWLPAAPMLKISCFYGFFFMMDYYMTAVYKALGKVNILISVEIFRKSLSIIMAIVLCRYGIFAMMWGVVFVGFIGFVVNSFFMKKLLNYGAWHQLSAIREYLLADFIMAAVLLIVKHYLPVDLCYILKLVLLILIGCVIFCASIVLLYWKIFGQKRIGINKKLRNFYSSL